MITRCSVCKRTHGIRGPEDKGVSDSFCARCYAVFYKDDMDILEETFKRSIMLPEVRGDVVWQGPEKEYRPGDLDYYNKVLLEAQQELSEQRGESKDVR